MKRASSRSWCVPVAALVLGAACTESSSALPVLDARRNDVAPTLGSEPAELRRIRAALWLARERRTPGRRLPNRPPGLPMAQVARAVPPLTADELALLIGPQRRSHYLYIPLAPDASAEEVAAATERLGAAIRSAPRGPVDASEAFPDRGELVPQSAYFTNRRGWCGRGRSAPADAAYLEALFATPMNSVHHEPVRGETGLYAIYVLNEVDVGADHWTIKDFREERLYDFALREAGALECPSDTSLCGLCRKAALRAHGAEVDPAVALTTGTATEEEGQLHDFGPFATRARRFEVRARLPDADYHAPPGGVVGAAVTMWVAPDRGGRVFRRLLPKGLMVLGDHCVLGDFARAEGLIWVDGVVHHFTDAEVSQPISSWLHRRLFYSPGPMYTLSFLVLPLFDGKQAGPYQRLRVPPSIVDALAARAHEP